MVQLRKLVTIKKKKIGRSVLGCDLRDGFRRESCTRYETVNAITWTSVSEGLENSLRIFDFLNSTPYKNNNNSNLGKNTDNYLDN
jgi:hypothetical protein